MRRFPKFDWNKYREDIDVKNLPGLKRRDEILRRQRYLFNLASQQMEQERKILETFKEQIESIRSGFQHTLEQTIPAVQQIQSGGLIHNIAKQFLPLATYEVRNKEGYLLALASTKEQLQDVLYRLNSQKFPVAREIKIDYANLLEQQPEQQYKGRMRKIITVSAPNTPEQEFNIFKVSHTKRHPHVTHYDTSEVLDRLNKILRSPQAKLAHLILRQYQITP